MLIEKGNKMLKIINDKKINNIQKKSILYFTHQIYSLKK